jgi:predicted TIM-barrel fold metal-dependent hydrolase
VLRAVDRGATWVKASAAFRLKPPAMGAELAATLLQRVGPERLVWGSDWPFAAFEDAVTYQQTLDAFAFNVPDEAARREMDRTALRLYFS